MPETTTRSKTRASTRFNNDLRYGDADHPRQWHLTPDYVLERVRADLGSRIDLDLCTFPDNPTQAWSFYTAADDGLAKPWWHGKAWEPSSVYVNPPNGKAREPWIKRCVAVAENGARVILLIPAATDTRIFQAALETAHRVVFIRGRVKFGSKRDNGRQHAVSHPSALIGWNTDLHTCSGLGISMRVAP